MFCTQNMKERLVPATQFFVPVVLPLSTLDGPPKKVLSAICGINAQSNPQGRRPQAAAGASPAAPLGRALMGIPHRHRGSQPPPRFHIGTLKIEHKKRAPLQGRTCKGAFSDGVTRGQTAPVAIPAVSRPVGRCFGRGREFTLPELPRPPRGCQRRSRGLPGKRRSGRRRPQ